MNKFILEDELVLSILKGNKSSFEKLMLVYKTYSYKLVYDLKAICYIKDNDIDDLAMLALDSVITALKKYIPNDNSRFFYFWKTIATNRIKKELIKNNSSEFLTVSFEDSSEFDGLTLSEKIGFCDDYQTQDNGEKNELINAINDITLDLSKKQKQITSMLLNNMNQGEICEQLKLSKASFRYHYREIVKKYKNFIKR